MSARLSLRVHAISHAAEGVLLFDLRPAESPGGTLPAFTPGAHVDLHLPGDRVRSYSLLNDCAERHRYLLGVRREDAGRGGSAWLHDAMRVGQPLSVEPPRNHFALAEDAAHSVLVAGGIGITPLWCMAQRLERLGRPWTLHYSARSRGSAALAEEIEALAAGSACGRATLHFDDESAGRFVDLRAIVATSPPGSHFYGCGPSPMLRAFDQACEAVPPEHVHVEHFAPAEPLPAAQGGFTVTLARSDRRVAVAAGQSILAALRDAGVDVPSSCEQGVCGACETAVLAGVPEHRDLVLSAKERAANRVMMICCSGCLGDGLLLDL